MNEIFDAIIQKFGRKTKKTDRISLYKTPRWNYYLPTDAHADLIAGHIKKGKIYDLNIYNILKEYIKPGTAVLDVGANFGQMSRELSLLAGRNGKVHAFEAEPFIYKILKMNCENSNNIICHFGAVSDKSDDILYYQNTNNIEEAGRGTYGSYGIDPQSKTGTQVKTICIDDINFTKPISAMKIDVEGWDLHALKGAVNTINKHRMPIIFEYGSYHEKRINTRFQDYVDFVASINYRFEKVIDDINYLILPKELK